MQLGMIGLGRMGANMVRRLMKQGHECVVFDVNADAVKALAADTELTVDGTRSSDGTVPLVDDGARHRVVLAVARGAPHAETIA